MVCLICKDEVEPDDVAVASARPNRCICVRCFARETGNDRRVPKALMRQVEEAMNSG